MPQRRLNCAKKRDIAMVFSSSAISALKSAENRDATHSKSSPRKSRQRVNKWPKSSFLKCLTAAGQVRREKQSIGRQRPGATPMPSDEPCRPRCERRNSMLGQIKKFSRIFQGNRFVTHASRAITMADRMHMPWHVAGGKPHEVFAIRKWVVAASLDSADEPDGS